MSTSYLIHLGLILHYNTYRLLNCRGHIQMTSNYSTIDMLKENNRVKKSTSHLIHLGLILHYITLTR